MYEDLGLVPSNKKKIRKRRWGAVAYMYNPSCSVGRDMENLGSMSALVKSYQDPMSTNQRIDG
jgi:hypothetical protein